MIENKVYLSFETTSATGKPEIVRKRRKILKCALVGNDRENVVENRQKHFGGVYVRNNEFFVNLRKFCYIILLSDEVLA